nr:unnamed protein product [Digitaria exilis]
MNRPSLPQRGGAPLLATAFLTPDRSSAFLRRPWSTSISARSLFLRISFGSLTEISAVVIFPIAGDMAAVSHAARDTTPRFLAAAGAWATRPGMFLAALIALPPRANFSPCARTPAARAGAAEERWEIGAVVDGTGGSCAIRLIMWLAGAFRV